MGEPTHIAASLRFAPLKRAARRVAALFGGGRLIALLLLLAMIGLRIEDPAPVKSLRYQTFDLFQRVEPRQMRSGRVAIIDIDEASIRALGQWPWSRATLARLVTKLDRAGAASIGFDIVFAEADRLSPSSIATDARDWPTALRLALARMPDTDAAFAAALAGAPVTLGMSGATTPPEAGRPRGDLAPTAAVAFGGDPRPYLFGFPWLLRNIEPLEQAASGRGLFTLTPEHDGVVRRAPAALRIGERMFPSLSVEMLRVAAGAEHFSVLRAPGGGGVQGVRIRDALIPTDPNGRIWPRFSRHDPSLYIPAVDVLSQDFDPARVKGKLVLVGTSAVGLRDLRITPLDQSIPGVEIHAQIIDAALSDGFLLRPASAVTVEHLAAALAALLLILAAPALSAGRSLPLFALLQAALWGGAYAGFALYGRALDPTYPSAALIVVYAALVYGAYSRAEAQRRQIRSAFSHYLSPDLVRRLAENPDSLRVGGESREMTFLFTDIAGFTAFTESAEPAVLVSLLNEYLDGACQIVMDHGGAIDKIVGDAVHAMFNAPLDLPDHAERAVRCALALDAFTKDFRRRKRATGHDFGETRIGVNTGVAVVGNFGGARRFDYTAHGDAINTAARLEAANKHLGTHICVSETTMRQCRDIGFRPIGALALKGKDETVMTYEPLTANDDARRAEPAEYEAAFELLAREAPQAGETFRALAAERPDDPLVALHARRLSAGETGVALAVGK